nr:hypothetical protein [Streptosporangium subroseum]
MVDILRHEPTGGVDDVESQLRLVVPDGQGTASTAVFQNVDRGFVGGEQQVLQSLFGRPCIRCAVVDPLPQGGQVGSDRPGPR